MESRWITGREILERWSIHPQELVLACGYYGIEAFEPETLDPVFPGLGALAFSWLYRASRTTSGKEDKCPQEMSDSERLFIEVRTGVIPAQDPVTDEERSKIIHGIPCYLFLKKDIDLLEFKLGQSLGGWDYIFEFYKALAVGKSFPNHFPPTPSTPEEYIKIWRLSGIKDNYEIVRLLDQNFAGKRRLSDLKIGQLLPADPGRTDITPEAQRDRGKRLRRKKK